MRSSILLASALAMGAMAKPLDKRVMVTEIDLEVVTVTKYVTAGEPIPTPDAQAESAGYHHGSYGHGHSSAKPVPSSSCTKSVAPKPTTPAPKPTSTPPAYSAAPIPSSSSPVPVPSSSSTPAPVPAPSSSQYAPPPKPSTSSTPAPAPSTAPQYGVTHKSGDDQAYLSSGQDYKNALLWHHNRARANHGAKNLEWSTDCESAASNAAAFCDFTHHTVDGQGQNLFTVSGSAFNVTAGVTESWYKGEADIYGAWGATPDMSTFHEWGHLSQILWKGTTHVGCVTIDCGSKMTINGQSSELNLYTVCNYSPPGNYEGEYAANVGAPIGSYQGYSWSD